MRRKEGLKSELAKELADIIGYQWVITEKEHLMDYLTDETAPTARPKACSTGVLVKPGNTEEISEILKLANTLRVPVFPRGGGTGLVGGAIPTQYGITLSLERMDKVIEVDRENLMIVVEAGVTLERLIDAANKAGLLFPTHPGDEMAQVGGLVACNAGGTRAVRYGVTREYVKGIEVVLPTGEILGLGGKLLKNVAGYDLMHLIIGSEGTLGVITRVVLRLYPKFKETITLILPYENRQEALRTVPRILQEGITPLAIEYIEEELMKRSAEQLGKEWPVKKGQTCLMIIVTGNSKEDVYLEAERIDKIAREYNTSDTLVIENRMKQKDILSIRSNIYSTLKPHTMDILDIGVPPSSMAKFMNALKEIAEKYNTHIPVYGHAGDGNLHPHLLMKTAGSVRKEYLEKVRNEIYDIAIDLGGTITAEHGIGRIRIKTVNKYIDKKAIDIMKKIKKTFDPNNILNPGKVVSIHKSRSNSR